jgi:hypothetical protein
MNLPIDRPHQEPGDQAIEVDLAKAGLSPAGGDASPRRRRFLPENR